MAEDNKYGYVDFQDDNRIQPNEPVFVLRARDVLALPTLMDYYQHCKDVKSSPEHLNSIMQSMAKFTEISFF